METHEELNYQEVICQATHCAVAYGKYDTNELANKELIPRIVDMVTTGEIPEGYTHLIFIAFDRTGYVVSRNLEGRYKVEICDRIAA